MTTNTLNGLPVKHMALSKLKPANWNPRTISDAELEKLKRSIETHGMLEPIIWNKRTKNIVGGHQRVKALIANGVTSTDVIVVDMDATQEKQANIALNKISGDWDNDLLASVFQELLDGGADLTLTGFEENEWNALFDARSIPKDNKDIDETELSKTEHKCPSCGFEW